MTQLKEHPGSCFSEGTGILCDCHQGLFCCTVRTGSHEPLMKLTRRKPRLKKKLMQGHEDNICVFENGLFSICNILLIEFWFGKSYLCWQNMQPSVPSVLKEFLFLFFFLCSLATEDSVHIHKL